MSAANRILVVRLKNDPFDRASYVVHALSDEWRRRGLSIDVVDHLDEPVGDDTLVFPHMDLTVTPPQYAEVFSRCAKVVNRGVQDISKRRVSRNRITAPQEYDGPVIVKTNRNAGGAPEVSEAFHAGGLRTQLLKLAKWLPWTISGLVGPQGYHIYDHPRMVPWIVWHNPRLIVEKFLPEKEGELYCLRQYVFLGPCEFNTRALAPDPLVKAKNVVKREVLDETPAALREFRKDFGFDYGKFDYVIRDGQTIVFDVNRTPSYNPASKAGSASSLILKLVPGIEPFLSAA
jgi:hypothetical protein